MNARVMMRYSPANSLTLLPQHIGVKSLNPSSPHDAVEIRRLVDVATNMPLERISNNKWGLEAKIFNFRRFMLGTSLRLPFLM